MGNEYHQGEDKYPKTLTYAYKPLVNWNQNTRNVLQFFKESGTNGKVDFPTFETIIQMRDYTSPNLEGRT